MEFKLNANDLKKNIGKKIKVFRKKKGLSQDKLAEIINIEMKSLSRIESGHNYPQCENLIAICTALDIEPWQLYFSENKKEKELMKEEICKALDKDCDLIPVIYQFLKILS